MSKKSIILIPLATPQDIRDNFVDELKRASRGEKSSLPFIINPLLAKSIVKDNEVFQVLGIGGSVYENALIRKNVSDLEIIRHMKGNVPLFHAKEDFLSFTAAQIDRSILAVAINFAQPLRPITRNGILDGELVGTTKEHEFVGLLKRVIGKELESYIASTQKRDILITVANDSVCLALSGLGKIAWEQLAAGIVGTGTTFSFFENPRSIVALESGNFNVFSATETGKIIDKGSNRPGHHMFEKEVAGAYLYQHFNILTGQQRTPLSSTEDLDKVARGSGEGAKVAQQLFERSAALVACQIAGIYVFKKQPRLMFVMQGSLFWKGWRYKEMVSKYVEKLGVSRAAIQFVKIENSAIKGAGALVTGYVRS